MIRHRYLLPTLIALSCLLGLLPTSIRIIKYGTARPFILHLVVGLVIGIILSLWCARWIKDSESEGVVYLGFGVVSSIVVYIGAVIAAGWLIQTHMSWLCPILAASEPNQCALAFSVFRATVELAALGGLYRWGVIYERQIRRPLIYRMALIEKDREIARRRKIQKK
jgi:hypothetical protein